MSEKSDNKEDKKVVIKEQIEYYLSDKNLEHDSFFHQKISENSNGYLDLELLLKCNKIKNAGWTLDEIKEGIKLSNNIELDKDEKKVRRKDNKPLPELVLLAKKRKKEKKEEKEEKEPIVLIFNCKEPNESKWKDVCNKFQEENKELDIIYKRFKDTTGHIVVRPNENKEEIKFKDKFICDDIEYEVKKCEGDDLINFFKDHGEHYQMCIKSKKNKNNKGKKSKNKKAKK
jgi:hypothetical protein